MSYRDNVRELRALTARKAAQKRSRGFWADARELSDLTKSKMSEGHGADSLRRALQEQVERAQETQLHRSPGVSAKRKSMFAFGFLLGFGWNVSRRK